MKMDHPQNIQSIETSIETGNLQSYNERSIPAKGFYTTVKHDINVNSGK